MKVEIKITVNDEGKVEISAPLEDKILCIRLLNIAYDTVSQHRSEPSRIIKPDLVFQPGK